MGDDVKRVKIEGLPMTQNGCLKIELVPMPSGDNPSRTRGDYIAEQKKDTIRFWMAMASSIASIIGVAATTLVAITTIKSLV